MIPVCEPLLDGNEAKYVNDCLLTNWISSSGEYITQFESAFAEYCGCKYGVATNNGTTALHLALASLGIGPGDEVIIPDFTIASCAFAVFYTGATPVFVDADPQTFNIDVSKIEEKITRRTVAIMPVHLYGRPAEMGEIVRIATKHNLHVIEDAAEAHGAEYEGHKVGGIGSVGCFSFYANKLITTGEGGMIVTNLEYVAEKAKLLRDLAHTSRRRFYHEHVGFNYRMTNIQAAIGMAQLEQIDRNIRVRLKHASLYAELLKVAPHVTFVSETRPNVKGVAWMHCLMAESESYRDAFVIHLADRGVQTRTFFVPMHEQPIFKAGDYPVSEDISRRGFYVPSGTGLTADQISYVCECIRGVR